VIFKAKDGERAVGIKEVKLILSNNEPKVLISLYWNEANYNRKAIINYKFDYWFFEEIYLTFNLVEKNAAKIDIKDEIISLAILGTNKTYQFKAKENQDWLKLLKEKGKVEVMQEIFIPPIPFLNVDENQLLKNIC
jgi:hypothetical protein